MSLSLFGSYVDPFEDLTRMQRDLDRMFALTSRGGEFSKGKGMESNLPLWRPSIDVKETNNNLVVRADLPGCKKEDINIELNDNVLTLSGERKVEKEEGNEKYHRVERSYGKFVRSIPVSQGIKPEQIQANFKDGVLEVNLPLPKEMKKEAKRINIV